MTLDKRQPMQFSFTNRFVKFTKRPFICHALDLLFATRKMKRK